MRRTTTILFALIILGMTSTACSVAEEVKGNAPTKISSPVLFQDDFSDPSSGWSTLNEGNKNIGYQNGSFHFLVGEPKFDYWSTPGLSFKDTHIEVNATKNSGPDDNDFGIICRYQDEKNFYGLLISSDGYFGISKMKNGVHSILDADGMQVSEAIKKGVSTNHLKADCIGNTLTLTVNDQKLFDVHDDDFASGDVGLVAGTFNQPGVDVSFNNFVVTRP